MVHTVEVATRPPYAVRIGAGVLAELADAGPRGARRAVLTDTTVEALHAGRLGALGAAPRLAVEPGEGSKSFAVLERVLDFLAEAGLDRGSCLVALGGGVVGDLGGLAAALFKRGCALVQCPTTLLAMVDSSVGGKTAVNLRAGKNLAGTFHQPAAVLADVDTLATLPAGEWRSGLGEVLKTALVAGEADLAALERGAAALAAREPGPVADAVARCVRAKAAVVARDPHEAGERKALNLGHTFAHAIERAAGFGAVPHGEAVAAGLALALRLAGELGRLGDPELPARVGRVLAALDLPAGLAELRARHGVALEPAAVLAGMAHDKKGAAGRPAFVLPVRAGELALDVVAEPAAVEAVLSA